MSPGVAYLLIAAAVFLATLLLVQGVYSIFQQREESVGRVNKRTRKLSAGSESLDTVGLRRDITVTRVALMPQRAVAYLEGLLVQAGLRMPVQRLILFMAGATLSVAIIFPIIAGFIGKLHLAAFLLVLLFAVSLGILAPIVWLLRLVSVRTKKLDAQFPIAVDVFVRGLRAGHPITGALELLVSEMPDPIRSEFKIVMAEMNYGYDLRGALENFSRRVNSQDVKMFVVSVGIQSETGGNLADILEGLSKVIRDRASMVMKVRALSSEGKMSGVILSIMPIAVFCFIFSTHPEFYLDVADDPIFLPGVALMAVWYGMGIFMMNRMIQIKV